VHEGEEGHARPGWTISRRGQDSPWKSQSEWQRTGINGESTCMVWPTLGSRTAKEQEQMLRSIWSWRLTKMRSNTKFYLQNSIYLFIYLMDIQNVSYIRLVVQPAAKCKRAFTRRTLTLFTLARTRDLSRRRQNMKDCSVTDYNGLLL